MLSAFFSLRVARIIIAFKSGLSPLKSFLGVICPAIMAYFAPNFFVHFRNLPSCPMFTVARSSGAKLSKSSSSVSSSTAISFTFKLSLLSSRKVSRGYAPLPAISSIAASLSKSSGRNFERSILFCVFGHSYEKFLESYSARADFAAFVFVKFGRFECVVGGGYEML